MTPPMQHVTIHLTFKSTIVSTTKDQFPSSCNLNWWHIVFISMAWRRRIWIYSFRYQTCQVVAVSGRHLHSSCSFRHIVWQPLAVARFLLQPQLSGTLCLFTSSHHLLLQPFAIDWRHSCSNSHFRTSSSDITNYVIMDVVVAIAILATLKNSDWLIDWLLITQR